MRMIYTAFEGTSISVENGDWLYGCEGMLTVRFD